MRDYQRQNGFLAVTVVIAFQKISYSKSSNCLLRVALSLQETFACSAIKDNFVNVFVFSSRVLLVFPPLIHSSSKINVVYWVGSVEIEIEMILKMLVYCQYGY